MNKQIKIKSVAKSTALYVKQGYVVRDFATVILMPH